MEKNQATDPDSQLPSPTKDIPSPLYLASSFRTAFASLSLHMTDRIRLLQFPIPIIQTVQTAIVKSWPRGIQGTRDYYGSREFKLRGNPWSGQSEEAVHSRRLMCTVLAALFDAGWLLRLSTDVSKKQMDKDTLIFRQQVPAPAPCEWMCISFSRSDRLRFIDAPADFVKYMLQKLQRDTQSHSPHMPGVYELKLRGTPWNADGDETMYARKLLLVLIAGLEEYGFTVYASIDQKTGPGGDSRRSETDTWHCCRTIGWMPGMPVFHA